MTLKQVQQDVNEYNIEMEQLWGTVAQEVNRVQKQS